MSIKPVELTDAAESRIAHAEQFLAFVHHLDFELRGVCADGCIASGLFRNHNRAARFAVKMNDELHANVYHSLNELGNYLNDDRDFMWYYKRHGLKIDSAKPNCKRTPRGIDFPRRRTVMIDIDPVRPSGTASTDAQLNAAKLLALDVRTFLTSLALPQPIFVCSGNGVQLLYRSIPCPTTPDNIARLRFFLNCLADKFDTDVVKIDRGVANPGRHSRVPGMLNRKGPNTVETPHRLAHVIEYPDEWVEAMTGLQAREWGYVPAPKRPKYESLACYSKVEELIDLYPEHLDLADVHEVGNVTYYALLECPFKGAAHRGQTVGHGKSTIMLFDDGGIQFKCFSSDCEEFKFADLLRHLREETGRSCDIQFWKEEEEDLDALAAKWGGIEDVSSSSRCLTAEEMQARIDAGIR
jgi:hypothetical protein